MDASAQSDHFPLDVEISSPLSRGKELTVLVVEDLPADRAVTLKLLEVLGYQADMASNGLEALEALRKRRYDVVLMDLQMPRMGGLETTRRIYQEFPQEERPCIIAVTSAIDAESRACCLDAGMDDYLNKPLEVVMLAEALMSCQAWRLGGSSLERAARLYP